jgi:hypothetical protein
LQGKRSIGELERRLAIGREHSSNTWKPIRRRVLLVYLPALFAAFGMGASMIRDRILVVQSGSVCVVSAPGYLAAEMSAELGQEGFVGQLISPVRAIYDTAMADWRGEDLTAHDVANEVSSFLYRRGLGASPNQISGGFQFEFDQAIPGEVGKFNEDEKQALRVVNNIKKLDYPMPPGFEVPSRLIQEGWILRKGEHCLISPHRALELAAARIFK